MASVQTLGGPSAGLTCALILMFTVLLQSLSMAVTYIYFSNELKQVSTTLMGQTEAVSTLGITASLLPLYLLLFEDFLVEENIPFLCLWTPTVNAQ